MRTFQTVIIISCLLLSVGCGQKNENKNAAVEQSKNVSEKVAKNNNPQKPTASPNRPPGSIPAPDFTLATTTGELVSMSELRGKVILLNFWGTWCGPCRMELPDFVKLHNKYKKDGLAIGDGFDWVLACDIRVGCENSRFMNAFLQMGLVSNTGSTWLYNRAMGISKALELLYTGDWLEADEAKECGVLAHLVSADKLEETTMDLACKIAGKAPIPNRMVKGMMYRGLTQTLDDHLAEAAQVEVLTLTSQDHKESLASFREKRAPVYKGE